MCDFDKLRQAYTKSGGVTYPFCGGVRLSMGRMHANVGDKVVVAGVGCLACKKEWTNLFKLTLVTAVFDLESDIIIPRKE